MLKIHPIDYLIILVCIGVVITACQPGASDSSTGPAMLAEFTESYVHVSIALEAGQDKQATLSVTFTPTEEDAHLYSKDLPKEGMNGLGRPTLVELPEGSHLQAAGELQESTTAISDAVVSDLPALPVYPAGAVTLRLPIVLPDQTPLNDQVLISYMACTPHGCHAPVMGKVVEVQIPGR